MHLRDRGRRHRRSEARKGLCYRAFQRGRDHGLRLGLRERRQPVLQGLEVARHPDADDVGAGREKLAELEIGGPHPLQRARKARSRLGAAALDQPRDLQRELSGRRHQRGIDGAEHALTCEHDAGAGQPRDVGERRDHKRQPECNATMPPESVCQLTRPKPAPRIMSANARGLREFADGLDEISIGLGVARDGAAELRDHPEREQVIEPIEPGHVDGGKFQAQEAPAGPQHAIGFLERAIDPRHVADAEGDRVAVEAAVGEGQLLGVALDKRHAVVEMAFGGAVAADREHVGIDVADGGAETRAGRFRGAEGNVAGAAGDVEQCVGAVALRRVERVDHDVLPDAVQASRHQVVHQVVALCHAVKHVVHQRLLLVQRHVAEAKMGGLVRPIHQHYSTPRTIARPAQWGYHVTFIR